ncbi:hypothetical protein PR202_gb10404 [Eleusine coracana subsp. coracana]|uniref:Uncharacterized protein n=1 Tax=Eleusine coracana subsp. coracana TaxID=191504 RepID=A0AAV5EJF5_ELECO|nr:hypothetical protein PR202_gb10404 [Eleusine coracana subsp. coracana]
MEQMSTLPWIGNYLGMKRALAWEPLEQRVHKLRKNTSPRSVETASFFRDGDGGRADGILEDTEGESQAWDSEGRIVDFQGTALGVDVTTSDSDDKENEHRIAHNCRMNSLAVLPHIQHTWGDPFPIARPDWDIIIASDIEPYAEQSANLVKTLSFLLREYKPQGTQVPVRFPMSLISWRRRVDPSVLFLGCESEGLEVQHLGYLVYLIQKKN